MMSAEPSPLGTLPAPPKRRATFWTRHRAAILTVAFALYTIALGVCIADDVLHLGLFPTELEREARSLIAQFDSPDAGVRSQAVERLLNDVEAFVTVPELIRALGSTSPQRRALADECLRQITQIHQGFDPNAPPAERRAAVRRWRTWWRENRYRY
jgi:hypothetical protein